MHRRPYIIRINEIQMTLDANPPDPNTNWYYHCLYDGNVHNSKAYDSPLFNVKELLEIEHIPPELANYPITTGVCKPCRKPGNDKKTLVDRVEELIKK